MSKISKIILGCTVAGLLASPVAFAATTAAEPTTTITPIPAKTTSTTTVTPSTTVTVTKTGPVGYHVCYRPMSRQVQASRIIQRCGYNGCRAFRVTRTFDVTVYENCHLQMAPCSTNGFARFGFYPTKQEARGAVDRCMHTMGGQVPTDWQAIY